MGAAFELPPRSPGLPTAWLLEFDVDCGEAVAGHHFVARGLASRRELVDPMRLPAEPMFQPGPTDTPNSWRTVQIPADQTYAEDDMSDEAQAMRWMVRMDKAMAAAPKCAGFSLEYELVPGVPEGSELWDFIVGVDYEADLPLPWEESDGGSLAPFKGGASTYGRRGSWPLPEGARHLSFFLTRPKFGRGLGQLRVDLEAKTAMWEPQAQGR